MDLIEVVIIDIIVSYKDEQDANRVTESDE